MLLVFVIGQAPRPELAAEIEAAIPGTPIRMEGALDGLSREEIAALLPRGRLGLFLPLAEQQEAFGGARRRQGLEVTTVALQPHSDDAARRAAAARMAAAKPDLVLLDCMSYTQRDKSVVSEALACSVLLSIAVAASAAASLLPER